MSDNKTRILVTDQATLVLDVLPRLSTCIVCTKISSSGPLVVNEYPSLLVLTPAQANTVLNDTDFQSRPVSMSPAIILWRQDMQAALEASLIDHPSVIGYLDSSCSRETAYVALRSGLAFLQREDNSQAARMLERVLDIGRALSSEKDLDVLLELILRYARELTSADGASIYTKDANGKLYLRLWQNSSTEARSNAQKTLAGKYSIAGYVSRTGEVVVVDDAYSIPESAPYRFSPAVDSSIGYRTGSMLTAPLTNKADEVVGVLQLINRKSRPDALLKTLDDVTEYVLPFDELSRSVALALSGQAGVALENSILYGDIERLFEGFISASVQVIEARDPTTAGHSFRVADFTDNLAKAVDRADRLELRSVTFTRDALTELRYAALLHDFGKVGVREDILGKRKKLYSHQLEMVRQRFMYARASIARDAYRRLLNIQQERNLTVGELAKRRAEIERILSVEDEHLDDLLQVVSRMNEPTVSVETIGKELRDVSSYTFPGENGEQISLLQPFEFAQLSVAKGNLDGEERSQIESHVSHTFSFLSLIPWTKKLSLLPEIAYAHHEKLDGSGYPRGLTGIDIPIQSKIMTIADIYDALTAGDRPYKSSVEVETALDILHSEAQVGKVDANLLSVFVESRAYIRTD